MRRKNSICFIVIGVLLIISIAVTILTKIDKQESNTQIAETEMPEVNTATQTNVDLEHVKYYLYIRNNHISVYHSDRKTLFFHTSIMSDSLTQELQDDLKEGIPIYSEEDLYSFLESYSS